MHHRRNDRASRYHSAVSAPSTRRRFEVAVAVARAVSTFDASGCSANTKPKKEASMPVVSMKDLLEAGVHFGHQTRRWNPKMKRFIFTERGGIYIIDLQQTQHLLDEAHAILDSVE